MASESPAQARVEDARRVWALADRAREEAAEFRRRAVQLEKEAARLDRLGQAVSDGEAIAGALGV